MEHDQRSARRNFFPGLIADNTSLQLPTDSNSLAGQVDMRISALYKRFVRAAIAITLTFGTFWGVSILTKAALTHSFSAPEPSQIQAHAHAQVFGWIGLLIMGVLYFAYPRMKGVNLGSIAGAEASFWLMTTGIVIRAIAQPMAAHPAGGIAVVISAVVEIVAAGFFVSAIYSIHNRTAERNSVSDIFIFSALGWLMVALVLNLLSMVAIARTRNPVIPAAWNLSRMNAEVFGFIATMILGIAARMLPSLLGVPEMSRRAGKTAAALFAAGVLAKVIAAPAVIGSVLLVAAVLVYIGSLGGFVFNMGATRKDPLKPWVIIAFFWLLAGGSMMLWGDVFGALTGREIPHEWVGAYRHAIAVGFITTMAVGMAHRTVPLFQGTQLHSYRLMWVAFFLLQTGNACRVIFQTLTLSKSPIIYGITGMSGYFELAALAVFGYNIVRTLRKPASQFLRELVVDENTAMEEVCAAFPDAKPTLAKLGLLCDESWADVKPQMSVRAAAQLAGLSPHLVVEKLNGHIRTSPRKPLSMAGLFQTAT